MPEISNKESRSNPEERSKHILVKLFLVLLLSLFVIAEGYYIFILRVKIDKQTEEIKNVSLQLQQLKLERGDLSKELSEIKKPITGEEKDGDTDKR